MLFYFMSKRVLTILVSLLVLVSSSSLVKIIQQVALATSPKCLAQLSELFENFSLDPNSIALQMLDATAKIPSGILSLNIADVGDFDQCIRIKSESSNKDLLIGKYCLGLIQISNSSKTTKSKLLPTGPEANFFSPNSVIVKAPVWALCLPNGCTSNDSSTIGNALLGSIIKNQEISIQFQEEFCQTSDDINPPLTTKATVTIIILALLLSIVLVCSLYDLYCTFSRNKPCHKLIQGCSVYTNGQKIFKISEPTPDQFPCLNGLRFFSILWVLFVHHNQFYFNGFTVNNKYFVEWTNSLSSMFMANGGFCVDTFLIITGVLLSYGFFKAQTKNIKFNLVLFYLHRYLRLTAPLLVVVLVEANLYSYLGNGPVMPYTRKLFQKNCEDYWWSTLLYVQNYVNTSDMCIGATWYISVDMQLYIIAPLILFGLWKFPKICLTVLCACIMASAGAAFHVTWVNHLAALPSNFYGNYRAYLEKYYVLTHLRLGPWLMGIAFGYFLFKIKQNNLEIKINRVIVCVCWVVCILVMFACVLGGHETLRTKDYNKWANALHVALTRPVWSLGVIWVILACTLDYGGPVNWLLSFPIYEVLNRFVYSLYLVHEVLLSAIVGNMKWPIYLSTFNMLYDYWGTFCISSLLAVALVFTTEYPVAAVEKYFLGKLPKEKKATNVYIIEKETIKNNEKTDKTALISFVNIT